jgi:hypothetical protein
MEPRISSQLSHRKYEILLHPKQIQSHRLKAVNLHQSDHAHVGTIFNQPHSPIPHLSPQMSNYSTFAIFLCAALAASTQQTDTIKVQTILVNEPITVHNSKGQLVDNLQQGNFHLTDNGVEQQVTHFELGGDALSLVILVETSLRIESLIPAIRKNGILLAQTVMGPNAEAAVIGFTIPSTNFRTSQLTRMPSREHSSAWIMATPDRNSTTQWLSASKCSVSAPDLPLPNPVVAA